MASLVFDLSVGGKAATEDWTWRDLHLNVQTEPTGIDLKTSLDYMAVDNAMTNLFMFYPGQNILFPEFGNKLYKYVDEPVIDITAGRIRDEILGMFKMWEPRIRITSVAVVPNADQNEYWITVEYSVPSLDSEVIKSFNTTLNKSGSVTF